MYTFGEEQQGLREGRGTARVQGRDRNSKGSGRGGEQQGFREGIGTARVQGGERNSKG